MRQRVAVLFLFFVAACAAPPEAARPGGTPTASSQSGIGTLAPAFRDYRIGTLRPGGTACEPRGALHYVESLEYVDSPAVVFGMDADGCLGEIWSRLEGAAFEHAVALATRRLGPPDGEDRAICDASGDRIESLAWEVAEGRFQLARQGLSGEPVFLLRPVDAPLDYPRLCDGTLSR